MTTLKRPTLGALEEAVAHAVELQQDADAGETLTALQLRVVALAGEVQGLLRLLQQLATDPADDGDVTDP